MWQAWVQAAARRAHGWGGPHTLRFWLKACAVTSRAPRHGTSGFGISPKHIHRPTRTNLASLAAFTEARIALHKGRPGEAVAAVVDVPLGVEPWYGTVGWQSLRPYAWAIAAEASAAAGSPEAESVSPPPLRQAKRTIGQRPASPAPPGGSR